MICPNCGFQLPDESTICSQCQTQLRPNTTEQTAIKKHNFNKNAKLIALAVATIVIISIIFFVLIFTHIICINHDWSPPTCVTPSQCYYCKKYKDDILGSHKWTEATCTSPRTCFRCNLEEGEPLEHKWTDATCVKPQTCKTCNTTDGNALGHDIQWSEPDIDYSKLISVQNSYCIRCEEEIDVKSEPVTTFVNKDRFMIYPYKFADRLEESSSRLNGIDYCTKSEYNEYSFYDENNTIFYRIQDKNSNYKDIGMISFTMPDGKTVPVMNEFTENCVGCINILIENSYDVSAVVYSAILAIDPEIGYSEAADVGQEIVDNIAINIGEIDEEKFAGIDYNGVNYLLFRDRKYHYLIISIIPSLQQ